jgi:hypothetical protein
VSFTSWILESSDLKFTATIDQKLRGSSISRRSRSSTIREAVSDPGSRPDVSSAKPKKVLSFSVAGEMISDYAGISSDELHIRPFTETACKKEGFW